MDMIHVRARPGETVTDEQRRCVSEVGGKVPANQFWLRRINNGEVILTSELKTEPKRFGKKID